MKKMDFAVIINTHSSTLDVWPLFYASLKKYFFEIENILNVKYYVFSDIDFDYGREFNLIKYNERKPYNEQFFDCLREVKEEYCLHLEEDYILYDYPKYFEFLNLIKILKNSEETENRLDFVKLIKGPESLSYPTQINPNLYHLEYSTNFYTNQTTIWKTEVLKDIYRISKPSGIADKGDFEMFEPNAWKYCKELKVHGSFYYEGEPLRGRYHHDSNIFPYIATAIVKGKWNLKEYEKELGDILKEQNIDVTIRGTNIESY